MFFQWQGNQPVPLRCINKSIETPDTVSIELSDLTESLRFQFKPGQFINLGIEIDGKMEFRSYSISSNTEDDHLQLTIKHIPGGKVSSFITHSLLPGDIVYALPPTGEFNCIDHPPKQENGKTKVLLISAGCGITPVFAMATFWLNDKEDIDIAFVHAARSQAETIYFNQLETYNSLYPNFHLKLLLKDRGETRHAEGRFNADWLQELVPDFKQRTVYLCGPNQFMQDTQGYLLQLGFNMENFYQESFTPGQSVAQDENNNTIIDENTQVSVPDFDKTIDAKKGQVLANVLEEAGLPLITACRSGICGSCKCKVLKGLVSSTSQETLTSEEINQGYVLACSSTIESELEIKIE